MVAGCPLLIKGSVLVEVSMIQTIACVCIFVNTYVVADGRVVLGRKSGIWLRLLERQKHVRELRVKQGRKSW